MIVTDSAAVRNGSARGAAPAPRPRPFVFDDGGRAAAGFRGFTDDCTTRAIAIATGKPYREVYGALNALAARERPRRRDRVGRPRERPGARTGVPWSTYHAYLTRLGWRWVPTMAIGSGCRVHLRAEELPRDRLIVRLSKHFVAVIDGVIRDTYDPSRGGTRCVYGYYTRDN
jgi:hypothetical protein